jgi:hypothetical protein
MELEHFPGNASGGCESKRIYPMLFKGDDAMTDSVTETPVRYRFIPVSQGIQLEIWELAPTVSQSNKSFLFRVKYLFPTQQDAQSALEDYLRNNSLSFAVDDDVPQDDSSGRRLLSIQEPRSLNP